MPDSLEFDEIHVWQCHTQALDRSACAKACQAMLSESERARLDRCKHLPSQREFLLARGLLRTVLARYLGHPPAELRFEVDRHGKPRLASHHEEGLEFNLSHSRGWVVCALTRRGAIGVDIEDGARPTEYLPLAQRYFASAEVAYLQTLGGADLRRAFFAIWTLKEAFVKALGRGLTYPLDSFAFQLHVDRLVGFQAPPEIPTHWHLDQFQLATTHQGALVVENNDKTPLRVQQFEWRRRFSIDSE